MLVFKASGGKLGCENTQKQTQDAQQICGKLGIGIGDAPPEAYEVPMRSTKYTRKMFSVACGTTQPATQPTQPQPNQPEREKVQKYYTGRMWWSCVRSTAKLGTLQIAHLSRLSHPKYKLQAAHAAKAEH